MMKLNLLSWLFLFLSNILACKTKKVYEVIGQTDHAMIDILQGYWASPCYLHHDFQFFVASRKNKLTVQKSSLIKEEMYFLDTACKQKIFAKKITHSYQLAAANNLSLYPLNMRVTAFEVAIYDQNYLDAQNKRNQTDWQLHTFYPIPAAKYPEGQNIIGALLFTSLRLNEDGSLNWGLPSLEAKGQFFYPNHEDYKKFNEGDPLL